MTVRGRRPEHVWIVGAALLVGVAGVAELAAFQGPPTLSDLARGAEIIQPVASRFGAREQIELEPQELGLDEAMPALAPADVALSDDGTLYAADPARQQVLVYGPDGDFLRSIGRLGEGPGEFGRREPERIALAGGRLLVVHGQGRQLASFDASTGAYLGGIALDDAASFLRLFGLDDGSAVGVRGRTERSEGERYVRREEPFLLSSTGDLAVVASADPFAVATFEHRPPGARGPVRRTVPALNARANLVCGGATCYLSDPLEYHVVAIEMATQRARWSLRVGDGRQPISRAEREAQAAWLERMGRGMFDASTIEYAEGHLPAIDRLAVDGSGNLYVFRWRTMAQRETEDLRAVDVYSADGTPLVAGSIAGDYRSFWYDARGDLVYGLDEEPETGEEIIAVRRLVLPER